MIRCLQALWADKRGATAIEYGLIAALIFLAIVTAVSSFAGKTTAMYTYINDTITAAINK